VAWSPRRHGSKVQNLLAYARDKWPDLRSGACCTFAGDDKPRPSQKPNNDAHHELSCLLTVVWRNDSFDAEKPYRTLLLNPGQSPVPVRVGVRLAITIASTNRPYV
jgi:hypothetical protein